ncbi:MAG: DUF2029 domain-containing protein [Ruminococcaceae bacterium]|nr:DUF2029 domain-containing protein [Oscillospiraceae bacterium]
MNKQLALLIFIPLCFDKFFYRYMLELSRTLNCGTEGNEKNKMNNKNKLFISSFNNTSKKLRMKIRCLCAVISRCILPFDYELEGRVIRKHTNTKSIFFFFTLSFLLGFSKLDMGIYPFGPAIIIAGIGDMSIVCFFGAALAALFQGFTGIIQFICFFLVFFIRKSISKGNFDESLKARMLTSLCTSAFIGACTQITSKASTDTVIRFMSYVIITIISTYLFYGAMRPKKAYQSDSFYTLCIFAVCMCLVPAFTRLSFAKIDLSLLFSCLATLWISKAKGPIYGCVCGFITGFACVNPMYSAPLGICGLISGHLFPKSKIFAILSLPVVSLFSGIYLFGTKSVYNFLPFTVFAATIFVFTHKYIPDIFDNRSKKNTVPSKVVAKTTEFEKVSESLSGLSSIIYKFSEHLKAPGNLETGDVFDKAFNHVCEGCSMNSMCYAKRECNFPRVKSQTVSILHSRILKQDELSDMLLGKCIKAGELCDYINAEYSELNFQTLKSNRTQTVASLYNSMSNLIKSTSKTENENKVRDSHLEKTLGNALQNIGVVFSRISVNGTREKIILVHGVKPDSIPCSSAELSQYLSRECRVKLSEPSFDISDSADMIIKFNRGEIISLEYAQCCKSKRENDVSGDTVSLFESDNGYFYSIIADGMGSGKAAAATSRLSCVFLEKMLCIGASKNVCLEMLNNLLLSKNDETFSTVDMLEIDKLSGSAYFIKAGAAPSFVLRKNHLYKIASETPPVGIISSFSAESTRFNLEKEDTVIMVSDGVVQSDADAVWLSEIIGPANDIQPAQLAARIIDKAKSIKDRPDDTSVCVIRVI